MTVVFKYIGFGLMFVLFGDHWCMCFPVLHHQKDVGTGGNVGG